MLKEASIQSSAAGPAGRAGEVNVYLAETHLQAEGAAIDGSISDAIPDAYAMNDSANGTLAGALHFPIRASPSVTAGRNAG